MNEQIKLAGVALLGAGVGFAVGYKLLEKRLAEQFDQRLEQETHDMREFYQTVRQPYASPEDAVKELVLPEVAKDPRVKNNATQYNKIVPSTDEGLREFKEPTPPAPVVQNVFDANGPRLITQDEFMQNEPEHQQATLTYYEASDQLCGEADEPIDNEELVVGLQYKEKFGWNSSDENVVHIRNSGLHMDFEVLRSEGSYEKEVLGVEDDSIPPHKRVGR
jgi:hypothetical protein